jgi:hypothetical protein
MKWETGKRPTTKSCPFSRKTPNCADGRPTLSFVLCFFSLARALHVCSSCSLACVLLERPLERLSSVGHSLITFPLRQSQLANKPWKKIGEMGKKKAKKSSLISWSRISARRDDESMCLCVCVCVEELFFDGGSSTSKMTSWRVGYLRDVDLGEAPLKKKGIRSLFG